MLKTKQLQKLKQKLKKLRKSESKDAEISKISDAAKRKEVMHELTGP